MSEGVPASVSRQPDQLPLSAVEVDEERRIIEVQHMLEQPRGMRYPAATSTAEGETGELRHIVAITAYRRRLTDAQRVILGLRIEPDIVERARRRQWEAGRASGDPVGQLTNRGTARDEVAALVGIGSGRTYDRGKAVLMRLREEAPDLIPSMESGEVNLRAAKAYLRTHGSSAANGHRPADPPASDGTPGDAPSVTVELRLRSPTGQVGDGQTTEGRAAGWVHVIEIEASPSDLRKPARLRWLGARIAEALYQAFEGKE